MSKNNIGSIPQEKFAFAQLDKRIHDTKFETKPIGYFKDAWLRFRKNKSSVVAATLILMLMLFALIVPYFSDMDVTFRDGYYRTVLPKSEFFSQFGFWDGCKTQKETQAGFDCLNAVGVETGMNAIREVKSVFQDENGITYYNLKVDSYNKVGFVFANLSEAQYLALQQYQNETGIQVIYPLQNTFKTVFSKGNGGANFWYKLADEALTTTGTALYDENGDYIPNYMLSDEPGRANYNSLRVEGDDGTNGGYYVYAQRNQTGYKVRVNYHNYFIYENGFEPSFLFGTNDYGQDIFVCLATGARLSFLLAICVTLINFTIGGVYGAIQGYYGGAADMLMDRVRDVLSGVPFIVVATLFQMHMASKVGPVWSLLFAFVLTGWVGMAGRVRMQFYRFKGQEFVLAARTLGAGDGRMIFKHIYPNALGTIITGSVLAIPGVIFSESMLSYLKIVDLETSRLTSIGTMLSNGQGYLNTFPHIILFPALFISILEISFNLFGNGLRDAFNPSLRGADE